jgi:hypothetical protein
MAFPNDSSRIARGIGNLEQCATDYANSSDRSARSLIRKTVHTSALGVLANGDGRPIANAGPYVYFKNPVRILGVNVIANVATSASGTTYAVFSLKQLTTAGVVGNTIANVTTQAVVSGGTGNIVPGAGFALTFSSISQANSYFRVAANSWCGIDIAQVSTGSVIGATTWAIDYEEEGLDLYGT